MLCFGSDLDEAFAVGIGIGVSHLTRDGDGGFSAVRVKSQGVSRYLAAIIVRVFPRICFCMYLNT